ncbi:MAG: ATP-binding cassette domain-containing protein [Chloroflexi bacterium]|nr:ATP-binding cassette domain-containing protein [Chloroflexota bacterium]
MGLNRRARRRHRRDDSDGRNPDEPPPHRPRHPADEGRRPGAAPRLRCGPGHGARRHPAGRPRGDRHRGHRDPDLADAREAVLTGLGVIGAPVVEVRDLVKVYGGHRGRPAVRAVDGITFAVAGGEFFGFLGPNGAGKTTTIRILATLTRPTSGQARVVGLDVAAAPAQVRARIGLAMQSPAIEGLLTGRENLELIGRLRCVPEPELRRRVAELIELMNLGAAADRYAGTYSGGMKRRLDLASALIHRPEVLFLDEPTEGLDPQSRAALWEELLRINAEGTTMFLTTHYMEEADRLCGRLAIVDEGRIVVDGTPSRLKRDVGEDRVEVALQVVSDALADALVDGGPQDFGVEGVTGLERSPRGLSIAVADARGALPAIVRRLDAAGVVVSGITMREPTLDDVFLRHCGRHIRAEEADRPIELGWM